MSRGIVAGVTWHEDDETVERVIAVPDARVRQGLDRLLGGIPLRLRPEIAQFLAPLLENNEPPRAGKYTFGRPSGDGYIVWWKRAYIEEP